jgi:phosphoenolpyruvate carboxylase
MEVNSMSDPNSFLHLIQMIPATFWGVVIGSLFTIGGVALSNRANSDRLRIQLTHEWNLKERERQLSLKRDIFLETVKALATGFNSLGTFTNLNSPPDKLGRKYFDKASMIAQVYLVGNAETISAIEAVSQELSAAMARLHSQRLPLILTKGKADIHRNEINLANAEVTRLLEQMKEMNIEGIRDDRKFNELQANFEFQTNQIKRDSELAGKMDQEVKEGLDLLLKAVTIELSKVARHLPKALASARKELGLPLDEAWFKSLFESGIAAQGKVVDTFISEMDETLKKNSAKQES